MDLKRWVLLCVICIFSCGSLLAQGDKLSLLVGLAKPGQLKIVMILDIEGKKSFEIVDDEIIRLMKKDLASRYKQAKMQWKKDGKDWKTNHPDFRYAMPKPLAPKVTVLKKKYHSRDEARADLAEARTARVFCLYQVTQGENKMVKIAPEGEFPAIKYQIEMNHHLSLCAWMDSRSAYQEQNPGETFDEAIPGKPKIKVLKKRITSEEKAERELAKYTS